MVYSQVLLLHELEEENRAVGVDLCIGLANRPGPGLEVAKTPGGGVPVSERGGPVHSYTVRAHHHDGSGGSERAAPNRNTPLAWRVQGVAPNEGNGQGKDRGSGSGALNHARARAGTGSARTAQKNQTRCMPDLREWVEHGQSHGGHTVTWDSPLTQGRSVYALCGCSGAPMFIKQAGVQGRGAPERRTAARSAQAPRSGAERPSAAQ